MPRRRRWGVDANLPIEAYSQLVHEIDENKWEFKLKKEDVSLHR
jgi:hypothetical protein